MAAAAGHVSSYPAYPDARLPQDLAGKAGGRELSDYQTQVRAPA